MTNREIDALVHQYPMGVAPLSKSLIERGYYQVIPNYSTDPATSKLLRDKMRADGWNTRVGSKPGSKCTAEFWRSCQEFTSRADTEEMAVAIAALKAKGIEVPV